MAPSLIIPTDHAVDVLDAWCRARDRDTATVLAPPPGEEPARLWRDGERLCWMLPGGGEVDVPPEYGGSA
jgi:hypothetical protein